MRLSLEEVMEGIYAVEENCSIYIGSDWSQGWRVRIGGSRHATFIEEKEVWTLQEAAEWLHQQALSHFPGYAKRFGVRGVPDATPDPP